MIHLSIIVKLNRGNIQVFLQNIYAFLAQHQLQLNRIMIHSKSKEESQIEWETGSDLVLLIKIISLLQSINLNDRLGIKIEDRDKIINQEVKKTFLLDIGGLFFSRVWSISDNYVPIVYLGSPNNFRGNPTHNNFASHHSPHSDYHQNAYRPFHRGTPRSEPGPRGGNSYRGAPGFFGTPQQSNYNQFQGRGGRYNSNPNSDRRNFRGNRGRGRPFNSSKSFDYHSKNEEPWSESGYFHPSMLENPWSDLEVNTNTDSSKAPSSADVSSVKLSDSMIPQVILINYLFENLEALSISIESL